MKIAMWYGEKKFVIKESQIPKPLNDQLVVKIHSAGICGTDIHITQNLFPKEIPNVLGHEFSGVIHSVGPKLSKDFIGKKVTCTIHASCKECESCKNWSLMHCENSTRRDGAFAQYLLIDYGQAYFLNDKFDLEMASFVEPLACVISNINMIDLSNKKNALVIGGGLLGLFAVSILKLRGVDNIMLSEPKKTRRNLGLEMGASIVIDPNKEDIKEFVYNSSNNKGVDLCIEAVGIPELLAGAVKLVRPKGKIIMIGVSPKGKIFPVDLYDLHYKEISISAAMGAGNSFEEALDTITMVYNPKLVAKRFSLNDIKKAFIEAENGEGVKYLISPN
ncbi:MAG: zinc-binding dehydrogenase [Dehalococcoidia bacterium]|tara:strand:- start:150 stop:1148 length:999 start_codon:yes stop_codon:yes gene_type:complete